MAGIGFRVDSRVQKGFHPGLIIPKYILPQDRLKKLAAAVGARTKSLHEPLGDAVSTNDVETW